MTTALKAPELRPLPWRRATSSLFATLGLLLLPKCPLCIAAYLVTLGVGAEAAHDAAPFVRPLAWAMMSVALVALALGLRRLRRRAEAETPRCCRRPGFKGAG
jgi:hypothetical protein